MRLPVLLALAAAAATPATPVQKTGHAPAPTPPAAQKAPTPTPDPARPVAHQAGPPALLAAMPAGAPADKLRRLLLKPYAEASRTELPVLAWNSGAALTSLLASRGADLVLLDGGTLAALCRSQVLTRLDWSMLDRARSVAGSVSDCGAGAYLGAITLAWDKTKFSGDKSAATPDPAPVWADLWDIARHPGRRGLQGHARGTLEIALLADGVAPGDIYRTLRTQDGVDRAFRKLDQLKPYIVWWDQPAQAADLLASGKALLTSAPIDAMVSAAAAHPSLGFKAAGSLTTWFSWALPQGAPHPAAAMLALVIAADPARQAEFATATGLGPATAAALDLLPPDARAESPSLAANQPLAEDEAFWAENGDKLEARFSGWLAH